MPRILHLDFETYSTADLTEVGLENYMRAQGFTVTVIAWAFDNDLVRRQVWPQTQLPAIIRNHVRSGGTVSAHNAAFEFAILQDHYGLDIDWSQMDCTMQRALAYGYPGGLLEAGRAAGATFIKDATKARLMKMMGKPDKHGCAPHHDKKKGAAWLLELALYCENDVMAERALAAKLPPLHVTERALSALDHRINRRGILVARSDAAALQMAVNAERARLQPELARVTGGAVQTFGEKAKMKAWLATVGVPVPSQGGLAKDNVDKLLKNPYLPTASRSAHEALRLWQKGSKSSIDKLEKFLSCASVNDDRARGLLQFYGAGRTGRWAGRLIQPQNLPRVDRGHDAEQVILAARQTPTYMDLMWKSPLDAIAQSLRALFVAGPGKVLVSIDFSQIEARVLAWLAGQKDVVAAFAAGDDVYRLTASKVTSTPIASIPKDSPLRQLGKVLVLACGYQMGWAKFQETAAAPPYNIKLTDAQAQRYLYDWRRSNTAIVSYWGEVEQAVRDSVNNPGAVIPLPKGMAVRTQKGVTQIRKPNSTKLTYHNMRLHDGSLVFSGVWKGKKWMPSLSTYGGHLVENIVQSVARDIMAEAMLRAEARYGLVPVLTVHDEIVWEIVNSGPGPYATELRHQAEIVPAWAPGLPVASELHVGVRYPK